MKQTKLVVYLLCCAVALSGSLFGESAHIASSQAYKEFDKVMETMRETPAKGRDIKVRELVDIVGEESVKLQGFGVVTGLHGTGDSSTAAIELLVRVAENQGIRLDPAQIGAKNVALVSVSAVVDPHQRTFDVAVKSISDSKSLQNGFLEASTLSPVGSSEIFAVASGGIALGARFFEAEAAGGAAGGPTSVTIGHPAAGFVIDGGELIREIPNERVRQGLIELFVKYPSDRTATNIADVVNRYMSPLGIHAEPTNASTISVAIPSHYYGREGEVTRLIADIGDLSTTVSRRAVITIDQGSGVIAMTEGVKMEPGSIAVSGLTVTVSSDITPVVRQGEFGDGDTSFFDIPQLEVSQDDANFLSLPAGTDLRKVQETLNALRLTPTSIISVFNAMHQAGMIHADIVVLPR